MTTTQTKVLEVFNRHPFAKVGGVDRGYTDKAAFEQFRRIYAVTRISPSGFRTRRAELVKDGRLISVGKLPQASTFGRAMTIWAVPVAR